MYLITLVFCNTSTSFFSLLLFSKVTIQTVIFAAQKIANINLYKPKSKLQQLFFNYYMGNISSIHVSVQIWSQKALTQRYDYDKVNIYRFNIVYD